MRTNKGNIIAKPSDNTEYEIFSNTAICSHIVEYADKKFSFLTAEFY